MWVLVLLFWWGYPAIAVTWKVRGSRLSALDGKYEMVGKGVADPILDHIGFLLQNGKASSSMIHMVPHLDLQSCGLAHDV